MKEHTKQSRDAELCFLCVLMCLLRRGARGQQRYKHIIEPNVSECALLTNNMGTFFCTFKGVMFVPVHVWCVCVRIRKRVCAFHAPCLFVHSLNGGTGRFARCLLVYWSLNRVNDERSQAEGREASRRDRNQGMEKSKLKREKIFHFFYPLNSTRSVFGPSLLRHGNRSDQLQLAPLFLSQLHFRFNRLELIPKNET